VRAVQRARVRASRTVPALVAAGTRGRSDLEQGAVARTEPHERDGRYTCKHKDNGQCLTQEEATPRTMEDADPCGYWIGRIKKEQPS
jgi:hypothetical protein